MSLRKIAEDNRDVRCIAVSHSDQQSTDNWLDSLGGSRDIEVVVDHEREIYAAYGLGASNWWHVLNPWSLASVVKLGRQEAIWNRPTESGSRWQTAGVFAVDSSGTMKYSHPAQTLDDVGDLQAALKSIQIQPKL